MNAHRMQQGKCIQCGCDSDAIDYFGWSCSGRFIQHEYVENTCINCGFCRGAIEHFHWPCRLDYRTQHAGDEHGQAHDSRSKTHWFYAAPDSHQIDESWLSPNDEIRYAQTLGLKGIVTKLDIRCAYREQANLYHPDRVAHLAPDIQMLATEKMKQINLAYAYFKHRYGI